MTRLTPLIEADDVVLHFPVAGGGPFGLSKRTVKALNGISLSVEPGETVGLVGESGSGKSTLGRALLGLDDVTSGKIVFDKTLIGLKHKQSLKRLRRETAMVFQDPLNALNPRLKVGEAIAEVLEVHKKCEKDRIGTRVDELLSLVGLDPVLKDRRPQALSGGQCQRVGIARALAVEPRLIIADECVAALDVSIQGQIINLFIDLQTRLNLTLIFIAHDLSIVRRLCDRVAVMYLGKIVEEGPTEQVFAAPRHPYTAALIESIPEIDPDIALPDMPMQGEPPSPVDLPSGCSFHPRCAHARDICREGSSPMLRRKDAHAWACVLDPGQLPPPPSAIRLATFKGDEH